MRFRLLSLSSTGCTKDIMKVRKFTDEKFKVGCGTIAPVDAWCKPTCKSHNPP